MYVYCNCICTVCTYFVSSFFGGLQIGLIIKKQLGSTFLILSIPPPHKTDRKENMNAKMLALSSFLAVAVSELGSAVFFVSWNDGLEAPAVVGLAGPGATACFFGGKRCLTETPAGSTHVSPMEPHGFCMKQLSQSWTLAWSKQNLPQSRLSFENLSIHCPAVEGRNPQQPPGMYKTLYGYLPTQLVQDFFHQQHHWEKNPFFLWLRYVQVLVSGVTPKIVYTWCSLAISQFNLQDASLPPI